MQNNLSTKFNRTISQKNLGNSKSMNKKLSILIAVLTLTSNSLFADQQSELPLLETPSQVLVNLSDKNNPLFSAEQKCKELADNFHFVETVRQFYIRLNDFQYNLSRDYKAYQSQVSNAKEFFFPLSFLISFQKPVSTNKNLPNELKVTNLSDYKYPAIALGLQDPYDGSIIDNPSNNSNVVYYNALNELDLNFFKRNSLVTDISKIKKLLQGDLSFFLRPDNKGEMQQVKLSFSADILRMNSELNKFEVLMAQQSEKIRKNPQYLEYDSIKKSLANVLKILGLEQAANKNTHITKAS
jgi:hypothetical protein